MRILQAIGPFDAGQPIPIEKFTANISKSTINQSGREDLYIHHIAIETPQAPSLLDLNAGMDKMYKFTITTDTNRQYVINTNDMLEFDEISRNTYVDYENLRIYNMVSIVPNQDMTEYCLVTLGVLEDSDLEEES